MAHVRKTTVKKKGNKVTVKKTAKGPMGKVSKTKVYKNKY